MRNPILVICFALTACAGATNVVPEGHDTYMIASHGTMGWSSGSAQKAKALEEADAYCKQLGKQMDVTNESDTGPGGFGKISSGEVHFRCVAPPAK
jgi:hypothetical protein